MYYTIILCHVGATSTIVTTTLIITVSVVGSAATLLVICGLLFTVMGRFKLQCHAKKNNVSSCDGPDSPVYECITGPVYE